MVQLKTLKTRINGIILFIVSGNMIFLIEIEVIVIWVIAEFISGKKIFND